MYEFQKSYSCEDSRGACGFFFMKEKFGKEITPTQAKRILEKGSSIVLKGFTAQDGSTYSGKLVLVDGKVRVEREK